MFIVYFFLSQSSSFVHLFSSRLSLVYFSTHISLLPSFSLNTLFILIFPPTSLPPSYFHIPPSTLSLPSPSLPPSPFHLLPSCFHPSPTPLPLFSTTATDGLWDVMTSQAAVDYVTDNLIRAGILPPRSEQSDDYAFQNKSTPARGIFLFIVV